jgi:predicted RNA-binding Zn-ribbon protein involved in translation (DUF1610 family)
MMGMLDRAHVPIICPKCGHRSMRWPAQLRRETHPHCTSCGGDVSAEADKMLRAIEAAERVLAEPRDKLRAGDSLQLTT